MVNRVCLDQFTWRRHKRAAWIVPADSWLPGTVKAVVAAENPPHTAERYQDAEHRCDVVLDDFGAAPKLLSRL